MKLYHSLQFFGFCLFIGVSGILLSLAINSCSNRTNFGESVNVTIYSPVLEGNDSSRIETIHIQVPKGSSVQEVLDRANLKLTTLDRTVPPIFTTVSENLEINIIRRKEEFETIEKPLFFEKQFVKNLNLPEGEMQLLQAGENGLEEVTLKKIFENGIEKTSQVIKSTIIKEPVPEIIMLGSQQPFAPIPLVGKIAYISGGNIWLMDGSTAERKLLLSNGKADGRVFSLSHDRKWLLFSQKKQEENNINSLWAIKTDGTADSPIYLQVDNVIHFADWVPNTERRVSFSTVEPRASPPGWQANNDLYTLDFSENGWVSKKNEILPPQIGGVYGWWGTVFAWSNDGTQCAYSRADEIGLVSFSEKKLIPLTTVNPLQTYGDWAWVSPITWSPDDRLLYFIDHRKLGEKEIDETSPHFDITALTPSGIPVTLISSAGMFAYHACSPLMEEDGGIKGYSIAYLQAAFAEQSQTSRYFLFTADRDGSDKKRLFPKEGMLGLEPQKIFWSPTPFYGKISALETPTNAENTYYLLVVYQGDIWLIDAMSGEERQITADGFISKLDWK